MDIILCLLGFARRFVGFGEGVCNEVRVSTMASGYHVNRGVQGGICAPERRRTEAIDYTAEPG